MESVQDSRSGILYALFLFEFDVFLMVRSGLRVLGRRATEVESRSLPCYLRVPKNRNTWSESTHFVSAFRVSWQVSPCNVALVHVSERRRHAGSRVRMGQEGFQDSLTSGWSVFHYLCLQKRFFKEHVWFLTCYFVFHFSDVKLFYVFIAIYPCLLPFCY